jgi:taurine--2-oxoglutarate transaminase
MKGQISSPWQQRSQAEVLNLCLKHNFWTWSAQAHVDPLPVERAQGVYLYDFDGQAYLDFNASVMCVNLGHGDQRVIDAIAKQANELAFAGPHTATRPRAELCRKLVELLPGDLNRVLFTLGGAEATENAMKVARAHTGRSKILSSYYSYHGATHGALAATGDDRRSAWEPYLMPGAVHFFTPHRYRSIFPSHADETPDETIAADYLSYLEQVVSKEGAGTIAAILLETVVGTNGVLIPPDGYLQGVRALCDREGILLICDEVMAGFGRTGRWFAFQHWGILPDMVLMAKGLTSGYAPLGALAMREQVAATFDERVFQGGLTYNGHPLSLAAAIANIEAIEQDGLIKHADELGSALADQLQRLMQRFSFIGDVRSIGLFGAMELVEDRQSRKPLLQLENGASAIKALRGIALEQGLFIFGRGSVMLVVPPLCISPVELETGFRLLETSMHEFEKTIQRQGLGKES